MKPANLGLDESTELWRYMSFAECLNILHNKRLGLRQLARFDDRLEGRVPKRVKHFHLNPSRYSTHLPAPIAWDEDALNTLENAFRVFMYASCWTEVDPDQPLMWLAYGSDRTCVAIRTSAGALLATDTDDENQPQLHRVRYDDSSEDGLNPFALASRKHGGFAFEREVRLLASTMWDKQKEGTQPLLAEEPYLEVCAPVDLVHEIVLHPNSDDSWVQSVKLVVAAACGSVVVRRSRDDVEL